MSRGAGPLAALLSLSLVAGGCGKEPSSGKDAGEAKDRTLVEDLAGEPEDMASSEEDLTSSEEDLASSEDDLAGPADLRTAVDKAPPRDLRAGPDLVVAGAKTTIRVHYPAGTKAITLRGSLAPLDWTTGQPMTSGASDTWTWSTTALTATLEFKPLLDDQTWSKGANYHATPGQTVDVYPHFNLDKGQVMKFASPFHSKLLNNDRNVWVYLPPSYLENNTTRLGVLYMHDGQNLFDAKTAGFGVEWKVDEALDDWARSGHCSDGAYCTGDGDCKAAGGCTTIPEVIVVGPENTARRFYEYTPTKDPTGMYKDTGGGDLYLRMLVEELKPQVDATLRTLPDREHTALAGSSLGGLITSYAGVRRPDVFSRVGIFSPSTWWDSLMLLGEVASVKGKTPRADRVYVDVGTVDDGKAETDLLAQKYRDVGYVDDKDLLYVVQQGANHNETYWAQRFPGAVRFLLGAR